MSATANSDWQIRVQFSQVEGFKHLCFADACKGPISKTLALPGNPPIAPVRLVTKWKNGKFLAEQALDKLISQYEAGLS